MNKFEELSIRLKGLAIFRQLLRDPVLEALVDYLGCDSTDLPGAVSRYAQFVSELYRRGAESLGAYVRTVVGEDENPYICTVGRGQTPEPAMEQCVRQELEALQQVADLTPAVLREKIDWNGPLPEFPAGSLDIARDYRSRCANIGRLGYGIYAKYRMFHLGIGGAILPVQNPDPISLEDLVDYKPQQEAILANTQALLEGRPAANILLTGDAGTGKSSTIKAVVNALHPQGLRILEVRKGQFPLLPGVLDKLGSNPLKFILFIDDLTFTQDDGDYAALKAILEGSVAAKTPNVAIYATSNRRHLVKETFSDRTGDDVHRNDTLQEILSLAQRFGLQITFQKPDKQTYLDIVVTLASQQGVTLAREELCARAEQFALSRGGRSPRVARQFVDSLKQ